MEDRVKIVPNYTKVPVMKGEQLFNDIDPYGEESWNEREEYELKLTSYDVYIEKWKSMGTIVNNIMILKKTGDIVSAGFK